MNRLIFSLILLVLIVCHDARAEADKTKTAAAVPSVSSSPAAKEAVAPIELKTKSAFAFPASARNPFWPIGWKPTAKITDNQGDHAGPEISPTAFVVSSITIESSGRYAIVNGKIMKEGQQFGLQLGNQTYQITLKRIEDGRVIIGRRDQEIAVPLRRK